MKELLIPCGTMDNLLQAIHNGADAVYLGGKRFGARAFAGNFDDEEMIQAIRMCHLYDVKIYVTVNTLCYESEFDDVTKYLTFLYRSGVDAVIVQDLGLIKWIHDNLPALEIHASTQVHNINSDGIKVLESLGVKRVVLARELSLGEINSLDTSLEIEAFIHGALCICYSGECLFSSIIMNRSGNRGECSQMCRLPYKLICNDRKVKTDGEYLLSTKELNTSSYFKTILDSKICSLKVEGRMKSPEYVACVTRLYRDLIDKYNRGDEVIPDKILLEDLEVIFNREYTKGFINNATNKELMNIKTSNHVGIRIGEVIKTTDKYIYIKLSRDLHQGDGIRFNSVNDGFICNYLYSNKEKLINHACKNEVVLVDNKINLNELTTVNKTLDVKVMEKYNKINEKKLPIKIEFKALVNEPMSMSVTYKDTTIFKTGNIVSEAINQPLEKERIEEQLTKLGSTPFICHDIDLNVGNNIFISIKDLNEFRRTVIDELIDDLSSRKKEVIINDNKEDNEIEYNDKYSLNVLVRTEEQLIECINHRVDRIIIDNKKLYLKYKYKDNVYYRTSRIGENTNVDNMVGTELGAIYNKAYIADYYLNITNHNTIKVLNDYSKIFTLSIELSNQEILNIMNYFNKKVNTEVIVYSTLELMITKYCPLNLLVNKDKTCTVCLNGNKYYLMDRNKKKFPIISETGKHLTHIMDYKPINRIEYMNTYLNSGIRNYRVEFLNENKEEVNNILSSVERKIIHEEIIH